MLNTNEVRIETSTECNYSCIFCPHSNKFTRKKQTMSFDRFWYIVDKIKEELPNITDLTISGFGESFLDLTILEKVKYAKDEGYKVHLLTNGYYLDKYTLDFLNEVGIEDLRIGLHSVEYDSYKKITQTKGNEFFKVIENIQYIIEKTNIPLILTFDIVRGINDNQLDKIIEKYNDNATIEVWKPHNWVSTFMFRKGPLIKPTCGRPFNGPYQIQVDGKVNMCCFDYNGKLLLGNFLTQTMEEIFKGYEFTILKKHHENGTLYKTQYICRDCDQRKPQEDIVIYNNKFNSEDRIGRLSTTYAKTDSVIRIS
jgi:sulfatase maturation enzyme AslB (radical SAM superfamily)